MTTDQIRVGVAGLSIGAWHVQAFQGNPGSQVTALCDLNTNLLNEIGDKYSVASRFTDWQEMITRDDVDAVSICLPNFLHRPVAVAAMRAGKHVLIEKPLALTVEEGEEVRAVAEETGRTAMVAMKMRYGPETAAAHEMIASGKLGIIYYGNNSLIRPFNGGLPNRPWFSRKVTGGGGALFDNGVHALDLQWYVIGRPKPVEVMAVCYSELGRMGKGIPPESAVGFDVEDFGAAIIRFANGSSISMENAWIAHTDTPTLQMRVYGTEGGLAFWPLRIVQEQNGKDEPVTVDLSKVQAEDQFTHFLNCIRTGAKPCSSIEDGIMLLRMLCAMYESAEKGRSVSV